MTVEDFHTDCHYPRLDFERVREFGLTTIPTIIDEAIAAAGVARDSIDCFVIGHAFPDVVDEVAERLGLSRKVINPSREHGHLGAGALPVGLSAAFEAGQLGRGAKVCLAACGAGFAWGSAVVQL
jgi:3-oxoacyl-[acyl-carrier-protein] synthase-3